MFSKLQKFSKFFNGNKSCQFYYVEQNCFQLGQSLFQTSKTEHLAFPTRICSKTRTFLKDLSSRIKYLSPCQIWFGEILPNPQPSIVHQFMTYNSQMLWKIPPNPQIPSSQNISSIQKIVAKPSPTPTLSQTLNKSPAGVWAVPPSCCRWLANANINTKNSYDLPIFLLSINCFLYLEIYIA